MKKKNNIYPIEGVIYEKPVRIVNGKTGTKNEGKTFEFPSIILEVKRQYKDKTYSELPEFEMGFGVRADDFMIGDKVEITFSLTGKKVNNNWHKTTAKALYIKHADIQGDDTKEVGGKTPSEYNKKDEVFVIPGPYNGDDEDSSDLPF